jgi:DNA-binding CsgD family transcriptional regulator
VSSLVGREAELTQIEAFLADGRPQALALVGEPGIGKTTLWQEGLAAARARGATALVARPAQSEAQLAFGGLADLLSEVPPELLSELPAPQRAAVDAALLRAESKRAPDRRVVATAFLSVIRLLAAESPVVVAVDDLQWLDAPSAAVVEYAARRLADAPVQLLVSVRADESPSLLVALERELGLVRIDVGPMSLAALHRILADTLDRTFPRPTLVRIAEASRGNPLHAIEIARQLSETVPVSTSFDELVRTRLQALPEETRLALLRAAALARPDTRTVDANDLAAAEEAGLVRIAADGRVHFVHPLFASSVYSAAPLARRRETHRALVDVATDPAERARHLALAADQADAELLAEIRAAAAHARAHAAPDTAAELIELALRLAPDEQELKLELAEHLYFASDFHRARELLLDLHEALEGDRRARALLLLSDIEYWRSGESTALALNEAALAAAVDPLMRARCYTMVAMSAGTVDVPKAAVSARAALDLLEGPGNSDPQLVAAALGARIRAALFLGEGFDVEAAERALALESQAPPAVVDGRVGFKLGQWLRYVDDFDGARARLDEAEQQARDEGDESSLANILLNRLIVETWSGDWERAAELGDEMVLAFEQQGVASGDVRLWRTYVDAHLGRLDEVRSAAEAAAKREPIISMIWNRSLGLAELAHGHAEPAFEHLAEALDTLERLEFRESAVWRCDGDAIEAAVESGSLARAELWLARLEQRSERSGIPWGRAVAARCRALVLAARGDLDAAAEAAERSLVEHKACPMPFERARTLLVQGQILRRLKRKREARLALEQARELFVELGTEPWTARVDEELQRVSPRRAPDDLSATELKIAELAASGLSNPEIAARVFVSRKTVEANLARAYRKLDISSRAQLHAALHDQTEVIS